MATASCDRTDSHDEGNETDEESACGFDDGDSDSGTDSDGRSDDNTAPPFSLHSLPPSPVTPSHGVGIGIRVGVGVFPVAL